MTTTNNNNQKSSDQYGYGNNPEFSDQYNGQAPTNNKLKINLKEYITDEINNRVNAVMQGQIYLGELFGNINLTDFDQNNFKEKLENIFNDISVNYHQLDQTFSTLNAFETKLVQDGVIKSYELKLIKDQPLDEELHALIKKHTTKQNNQSALFTENEGDQLLQSNDPEEFKKLVNKLPLSSRQKTNLLCLGPKTPEELQLEKERIKNKFSKESKKYRQFTQLYGSINQSKIYLYKIIEVYNQELKTINESITDIYQSVQLKIERDDKQKQMYKKLGISLCAGKILYADDWSWDPENPNQTEPRKQAIEIIIEKIDFENADIPFLNNYPSIEPVVHFKYKDPLTNEEVTEHLSSSAFIRYATSINLSEKIDRLDQLEESLQIPNKIHTGQIFETIAIEKDDQGISKEIPIKVKIINIDEDQGTITLDQEVDIEPARPYAGEYKPNSNNKMTFSQFAKWIRSTETIPEIKNINEINEELQKFQKQVCEENNIDQDQFPVINLNDPLPIVIQSNNTDNPELYIITSVTPQQITFNDGSISTPSIFLRDVKKNYLCGVPESERAEAIEKIKKTSGKEPVSEAIIQDEIIETAYKKEKERLEKSHITPDQKASIDYLGPARFLYNRFFKDIHFINLIQLWKIFSSGTKHIVERIKERGETTMNKVGANFYHGKPFMGRLADEYLAKVTSKTLERIKNRVEWMKDNMKEREVFQQLYENCDDMIEMRACLEYLAAKGLLREDDEKLHKVLNRLIKPTNYPETAQIPKELWGQRIQIDKNLESKIPVVEQIKLLMNQGMFETAFNTYFGTSESQYREIENRTNSNLHSYEFLGEGIGKEIQKRLIAFENGDPVDSAEFDGLLHGAIDQDEVSEEQGLLMFLAAWGARSKNDPYTSLLPYSKMYPYIGMLRENAPYLFFALKHPLHDVNGNLILEPDGSPKKGHLTIHDFAYLYKKFAMPDITANRREIASTGGDPFDPKIFTAGASMIHWLQKDVLTNSDVIQKVQDKSGVQPAMIFHHLGPLLTDPNDIDTILRRGVGGRDQANIVKTWYEGYSTHMMARTQKMRDALNYPDTNEGKLEKERVIKLFSDTLKSFSYFDSILNSRIKLNEHYTRFQPSDLDIKLRADKKRKVSEFADEARNYTHQFACQLAARSGDLRLAQLANLIFGHKVSRDLVNEENEFRNLLVKNIKDFGQKNLLGLIEISEQVIHSTGVQGLSGVQASKEEAKQLDYSAESYT